MAWVYFKIFIYSYKDRLLFREKLTKNGMTEEGNKRVIAIEKRIRDFQHFFNKQMSMIYIFHYSQRASDIWNESIQEWKDTYKDRSFDPSMKRVYEYIRVRFWVIVREYWTLRDAFIRCISEGNKDVIGYFYFNNYTATGDVGARFGNLAEGINPVNAIIEILTGNTFLRFYMLDHPDFELNHDLIHLYFNTMGYNYQMEKKVLQDRIKKINKFLKQRNHKRK